MDKFCDCLPVNLVNFTHDPERGGPAREDPFRRPEGCQTAYGCRRP